MENLNAEQVISELDCQTRFAKFSNSNGVLISVKCAQFVLDHVQRYEQRIGELAIELEAMRGAANSYKMYSKTLEDENKKLKALVDEGFDTENSLNGKIKELTEENERLKAQKYYLHSDGRIEMIPTVESVRAEGVRCGYAQGVRDFAERVKNYYRHTTSRPLPATVEYYIDQLEKEMLDER